MLATLTMKSQTPTNRILELVDYCKYKKLKGIDSDRAFLQVCQINDTSLLADIRSDKVRCGGVEKKTE